MWSLFIVVMQSRAIPELRSPWPAVGKRELWEHPFQACAIAYIYADWDCTVSRTARIWLFAFVISKWTLLEVSFSDHEALGTRLSGNGVSCKANFLLNALSYSVLLSFLFLCAAVSNTSWSLVRTVAKFQNIYTTDPLVQNTRLLIKLFRLKKIISTSTSLITLLSFNL